VTKIQHFKKIFNTHTESFSESCSKNKGKVLNSTNEPRTPLKTVVLYSQHNIGQQEITSNNHLTDLMTLAFKA